MNDAVKVFAIEPIDETFKELLKNIELNNYTRQIMPVPVALSFAIGEGKMIGNDGRAGSSGAQLMFDSNALGLSVRTMTGDQILGQIADPSAIVKIDIDGNEFDVLRGLEQSFEAGLIESVLVETTSANVLQIEKFLESYNLFEDTSYLEIEGHSNHRRINSGNRERTKIFSRSRI